MNTTYSMQQRTRQPKLPWKIKNDPNVGEAYIFLDHAKKILPNYNTLKQSAVEQASVTAFLNVAQSKIRDWIVENNILEHDFDQIKLAMSAPCSYTETLSRRCPCKNCNHIRSEHNAVSFLLECTTEILDTYNQALHILKYATQD